MDNQSNQLQATPQQLSKPPHAGGRPTVITEKKVSELIAYRQQGLSIETACALVQVSEASYYRRLETDDEFREQMEKAKEFGKQLAGNIVLDVLTDAIRGLTPMKDKEGNVVLNKYGKPVYPTKYGEKNRIDTAKWYLERKERAEFGTPSNTVIGVQNNNVSVGLRSVKDRMQARIDAEKATEAEVV